MVEMSSFARVLSHCRVLRLGIGGGPQYCAASGDMLMFRVQNTARLYCGAFRNCERHADGSMEVKKNSNTGGPPSQGRKLVVLSPERPWIPSGPLESGGRVVEVERLDPGSHLSPAGADVNVVAFLVGAYAGLKPDEVIDSLKEFAPEATFLAVSEEPETRQAVLFLKCGVYEYLIPPLTAPVFLETLREALDNNDAYREIMELNRALVAEKEELKYKNMELTAISTVARTVSRSLELDEVMERLVSCVEDTFAFDRVSVGLLDNATLNEHTSIARGVNALMVSGAVWDVSGGEVCPWVSHVYHDGLVLSSDDPESLDLTAGTALARLHCGPMAKIPMVARGSVLGSITVDNHLNMRPITEDEIAVLKVFADTAAVAVENSRLYHMVRELSLRDELTGLYNRRFLTDRVEAELDNSRRRGIEFTVAMLDLDYFKKLNDLNDHLVGDRALKNVARTLVAKTRGVDVVARFGGEEMVVLLPSTGFEDGLRVAEKLRAAVEEAVVEGEEKLPGGRLTVSIGVASYPRHGGTMAELLEAADKGLYAAKEKGRNRVESV